MGLPDRLDTGRKPTGLPCSVQELLDNLDEEDSNRLHRWLFELGYSQEVIFKALKDEGHVVGKQTINRHRGGACRCFQ